MDISGTKYILMFFLFYISFKSFFFFSLQCFSLLSAPQTQAVRDPQPAEATGGGSAAPEQTRERLQHQPDHALLAQPALLQP